RRGGDSGVDGAEGVVILGCHEGAADDVDDGQLTDGRHAVTGRARWVVDRPQDRGRVVEVVVHLAMLKGVVAPADDVDAAVEQLTRDAGLTPATAGDVLAVYDHVVEAELAACVRDNRADRVASGVADNVAQEEESHGWPAR